MASASSSSAKILFSDSKRRLADRVTVNVHNVASVAKQIVRGSKTNEMLMQSAKNFCQLEATMDKTADRAQKLQSLSVQQQSQVDAICEAADQLENLNEQIRAMER